MNTTKISLNPQMSLLVEGNDSLINIFTYKEESKYKKLLHSFTSDELLSLINNLNDIFIKTNISYKSDIEQLVSNVTRIPINILRGRNGKDDSRYARHIMRYFLLKEYSGTFISINYKCDHATVSNSKKVILNLIENKQPKLYYDWYIQIKQILNERKNNRRLVNDIVVKETSQQGN